MSVRERPCQNRFLDMREKEEKYRNHLHLVKTCKSTLDMTQPEMCRRLKLKKRNDAIFRERTIRNGIIHNRMVEDARRKEKPLSALADLDKSIYREIRRPKTTRNYGLTAEHELFRNKYQASKGSTKKEAPKRVVTTYADSDSQYLFGTTAPNATEHQISISNEGENIKIETVGNEEDEKIVVTKDKKDTKEASIEILSDNSESSNESDKKSDKNESLGLKNLIKDTLDKK